MSSQSMPFQALPQRQQTVGGQQVPMRGLAQQQLAEQMGKSTPF